MPKWILVLVVGLALLISLTAVTSAAGYNVTVKPIGAFSNYAVLTYDMVTTEFGLALNQSFDVIVGVSYASNEETIFGTTFKTSQTLLDFGGRYYLKEQGQTKPYLFGALGLPLFGGDLTGPDSAYVVRGGAGAVLNVAEEWAVIGETGLAWLSWKDGSNDGSYTSTFASIGLRYSF